jgi:hypothetical protein
MVAAGEQHFFEEVPTIEEPFMTDETGSTTPDQTPHSGPTTSEAWDAVLARMSDFGVAVTAWAGAAAKEPDTKEKLDQIRAGIDGIEMRTDAALGRAVRSQAGQAIGDAAHTAAEVAAPHVRNLFAELADIFGKAATKVDETMKDTGSASVPPVDTASPAAPADPNDR